MYYSRIWVRGQRSRLAKSVKKYIRAYALCECTHGINNILESTTGCDGGTDCFKYCYYYYILKIYVFK